LTNPYIDTLIRYDIIRRDGHYLYYDHLSKEVIILNIKQKKVDAFLKQFNLEIVKSSIDLRGNGTYLEPILFHE